MNAQHSRPVIERSSSSGGRVSNQRIFRRSYVIFEISSVQENFLSKTFLNENTHCFKTEDNFLLFIMKNTETLVQQTKSIHRKP